MPFKCGHCGNKHNLVSEYHACRSQIRHAARIGQYQMTTGIKTTLKTPLMMLRDLEGYFAARPDDTVPWVFFRVSHRDEKSKKYPNCTIVQTCHGSPDGIKLKMAYVVYPNDSVEAFRTNQNRLLDGRMLIACINPNQAHFDYAEQMESCMRCNADLTDPKSIHYRIGPECVKYWPHIIDLVDDSDRGPYKGDEGIF